MFEAGRHVNIGWSTFARSSPNSLPHFNMSSMKRSLSERMAYTFIQSDLGFYVLGRSIYIGATSIWVWPGIKPFYHGSCPISASKAALACVLMEHGRISSRICSTTSLARTCPRMWLSAMSGTRGWECFTGKRNQHSSSWQNLDYNVYGGKLNSCMSVVDTAKIIKGADGWWVPKDCHARLRHRTRASNLLSLPFLPFSPFDSQLQAFFLVSDDMMDSSIMRRGQPRWYCVPKVGQIAINDSFILETAVYYLLKKHFC